MADRKISAMLERLGDALSAGDTKAAATCFETPALVLSDDGSTAISAPGDTEKMFEGAKQYYHDNGLVSTKPRGARVRKLSATLSVVDVEWPSYDAKGRERQVERSHYIVHAPKGGDARIQVAMSRQA